MTRREDSKAETKILILNAARILFWERGADKCTIRDIAKEAGVSPATIIIHFKNKTALLEAALHEDIENNLAQALASLPSDQGLQAIFIHILKEILTFYDRNRDLYRILIRDTFFESVQDSPAITELDKKYLQFIVTLLDSEKNKGIIRREIDSHLAACSLFNLYIGVLREFLRDPGLSVPKALDRLSATFEQYLTGLLTTGDNQ